SSRAALPDTARGKDLYQVCAILFELSHHRADLLRGELWVFNRLQRSQQPRSRQAAVDGRPQFFVFRRTHTLDRGKAGHERGVSIPGGCKRRLLRRLTLIFYAAIGTKVPGDVIVQIDPSRHHGRVTEIVSGSSGNTLIFCVRLDADNLAALHHDQNIVQRVALAIEQGSGADYDGLRLCIWLSLRACKQSRRNKEDREPEEFHGASIVPIRHTQGCRPGATSPIHLGSLLPKGRKDRIAPYYKEIRGESSFN